MMPLITLLIQDQHHVVKDFSDLEILLRKYPFKVQGAQVLDHKYLVPDVELATFEGALDILVLKVLLEL